MPLFDRGYRAAATAELERSIRELEERKKREKAKAEMDSDVAEVLSNLSFAERLNLISEAQARAYRRRVQQLREELEHVGEDETEINLADGYESSQERIMYYQSMDEYNSQIAQKRAEDNKSKNENAPNHDVAQEEKMYTY